MEEYYHKYYTQYLNREMEMLVFGFDGYPLILFPADKGRFYDAKDFGLIDSLRNFIDEGKIKIYCPDSLDSESWYNYNIHPSDRVKTHLAYERMILHDVLEFAKYETEYKMVGVAGGGLGAYHAANLTFKYPSKISHLFGLSGTYNIKNHIMGYYDDDCFFNNPFDYLPGLVDEWYLKNIKKTKIILGSSSTDSNFGETKHLSKLLSEKEIEHQLEVKNVSDKGWELWKQMLPEYLAGINY